jgi:sec-independent protein translocase protein TatA
MLLAFYTPGPLEIIVIVLVVLLLFGKRLPGVGRSLGRGIVEFKKGLKDVKDEVKLDDDGEQSGSADRP